MVTGGLYGCFRTSACALATEHTEVFIDDRGFFYHGRVKAASLSLELLYLSRCMDGNQGVFSQLLDISPERTKCAMIRRIEFIQPGNLAAEDASLLHEMNGMAARGKIESRANAGDAAANDQNRRFMRAIHLFIFLFFNDPVGFAELLDPFHKPVLEILFAVFLACFIGKTQ